MRPTRTQPGSPALLRHLRERGQRRESRIADKIRGWLVR